MRNLAKVVVLFAALLLIAAGATADDAKVLTNHVGYERTGPKRAVVQGKAGDSVSNCALKREGNNETALALDRKASGPCEEMERLDILDHRFRFV